MDNPKILTGCDGSGRICIVKVLKRPNDSLLSIDDKCKEIEMEIKAVEILNLEKPTFAFVTASLKTLTIRSEDAKYSSVGGGSFHALVMPIYAATVTTSPGFKTAVLAREGRRILEALASMHSKNIVHMDVKGNNIFVDYLGNWCLGDFGSCTFTNNPVTSCSEMFYFEKVLGKPALPKYDFLMLMITLLIETLPDKHNFVSELEMKGSFMNEKVVEEKVLSIVSVGDEFGVLRGELLELFRR
jgi:serine/threonine protein kinase